MSAHPHAALMLQYAQDAAETDKPWERWEYRLKDFQPWVPLNHSPHWSHSSGYRRKPKTIKVNGFAVPEPLKTCDGHITVWWITLSHAELTDWTPVLGNRDWITKMCARGIIHATKEAAVAHAKAMLGIDPKEGE